MTASLRPPDSFEETLADLLRIKAPTKKAKAAKKRAAKKNGKGETVIRPAERTCPIHGGFLKQQSRRVEPPGMILQDPVPESLYGCPEEGCTFRLEVCPHDEEVLEYYQEPEPTRPERSGDQGAFRATVQRLFRISGCGGRTVFPYNPQSSMASRS